MEDLDRAFDLWERNKDLPPKERWSKNKISKETCIPYTTICERLSGRRGAGKRGKIAGGKCTAKVLKAGKFKRVTLTAFKRVMLRAGNRPLEHLYNPPFLYVFPKIEQEQSLVETIMIYARRGFPFSQNQLRVLAYEMAARDGQKGFSPIKQRAGRYCLKGFYLRYPEVRKMEVNLWIARAIGVNPAQIMKFFNEYRKWLDTWELDYTPNRIWNVDECGIGDVPQPIAVIGITGECTFQTASREKPQNSMIFSCMSTGGGLAMPHSLFSRRTRSSLNGRKQHLQDCPIFKREENLSRKQQSPVTTGHAQITSFQFGIHGIHEVKKC